MPAETIRELFLQQLETTFTAMASPTYWYSPAKVAREWLNPLVDKHYPHISIVESDEDNEVGGVGGSNTPFGFTYASLAIELQGALTEQTKRSRAGGRLLRDIETALMTLDGQTFGGAKVDVAVIGKALPLTAVEAPLVVCALAATVRWVYRSGDPSQA